jgi:hypothetical protein
MSHTRQKQHGGLAGGCSSNKGCSLGVWRSLVAHLLWEQGAGGSNPLTPTSLNPFCMPLIGKKVGLIIVDWFVTSFLSLWATNNKEYEIE